jgi:hypothetical protein
MVLGNSLVVLGITSKVDIHNSAYEYLTIIMWVGVQYLKSNQHILSQLCKFKVPLWQECS